VDAVSAYTSLARSSASLIPAAMTEVSTVVAGCRVRQAGVSLAVMGEQKRIQQAVIKIRMHGFFISFSGFSVSF
jgi:hypothetical protein